MLTGGCQCGALRYEVRAEPRDLYVCHCTECRAQSASAFGISVIVPSDAVVVTRGAARIWRRDTGSGRRMACHFCPDCGTRLWHAHDPDDGIASVKGGSLDTPPDLTHAAHIWTRSKLPGVLIPEGAARSTKEQD